MCIQFIILIYICTLFKMNLKTLNDIKKCKDRPIQKKVATTTTRTRRKLSPTPEERAVAWPLLTLMLHPSWIRPRKTQSNLQLTQVVLGFLQIIKIKRRQRLQNHSLSKRIPNR